MEDDHLTSENLWVTDSKFYPYKPNTQLVLRNRLINILTESIDKKVIFLTAPAGYGKSTLSGQWFMQISASHNYLAWLTVDSADSDINQFLSYFVLALEKSGVELPTLITGAQNHFENWGITRVSNTIIKTLNELDKKCICVLEDFHTAETPEINTFITRLIREIPQNLCLVIDSRTPPKIDTTSLIVSGEGIVIPASRMKLTESETVEILSDVLPESQAKDIYIHSEGWPVVVQLARIQRLTRPNQSFDSTTKGNVLPSYLTEQVLSSLHADEQNFLLAASCLGHFNADLMDFVLEEKNSASLVQKLSNLSPLFLSLNDESQWYRLNPLFSEYLSNLLKQKEPESMKRFMLRAADWYIQETDIVRAINCFAKIQDYERCHSLLYDFGGWSIILNQGIGTLRAAIRLIPTEEIARSVSSLIARSYLHCKDGEIFEARSDLERAWLIKHPDENKYDSDRLVVESMILLYEDKKPDPIFLSLRETLLNNNSLSPLETATVHAGAFIRKLSRPDIFEAAQALKKSFKGMRESDSVLGLNYCYLHAGHLNLLQGETEVANANINRALKLAEDNFGSDSGLKNMAHIVEFSLSAWRGNLTQEQLPIFELYLDHIIEHDGWTEIYALGLEAITLSFLENDMKESALNVLSKFLSFSKLRGLTRLSQISQTLKNYVLFPTNLHLRATESSSFGEDAFWLDKTWQAMGSLLSGENLSSSKAQYKEIGSILETQGLLSHKLLLDIHYVLVLWNTGDKTLAKELLLNCVLVGIDKDLSGPFKLNPSLMSVLQEIKRDIRGNDSALMEQKFIDDIVHSFTVKLNATGQTLFSNRENEVLQCLSHKKSNKEIARELELTENTVKFHLKSIFAKLGVNKRNNAVSVAKDLGYIQTMPY